MVEAIKDLLKTYSVVNDFMLRPPNPSSYDFNTFDRLNLEKEARGGGGNNRSRNKNISDSGGDEEEQEPAINDSAAAVRLGIEVENDRGPSIIQQPSQTKSSGGGMSYEDFCRMTGGIEVKGHDGEDEFDTDVDAERVRSTSSSISLHMIYLPCTRYLGRSSSSSSVAGDPGFYDIRHETTPSLTKPVVPCLYMRHTTSPYLMVFFHGNACDIGYPSSAMLELYALKLRVSVLAVEYPGYGLTRGQHYSEAAMLTAGETVVNFLLGSSGSEPPAMVPRQLLLMGQSIGCGVATHLASVIYDRFQGTAGGGGSAAARYTTDSGRAVYGSSGVMTVSPGVLGALILKSGFMSIKNVISDYAEIKEQTAAAYYQYTGTSPPISGGKSSSKGSKGGDFDSVDKTSDDGDPSPSTAVSMVVLSSHDRQQQAQRRRTTPNRGETTTTTTSNAREQEEDIFEVEDDDDEVGVGAGQRAVGTLHPDIGPQYIPPPPGKASGPLLFQLGRYVTLDRFSNVTNLENLSGKVFSPQPFHRYPNSSLNPTTTTSAANCVDGSSSSSSAPVISNSCPRSAAFHSFTPLLFLHGMADEVFGHAHSVVNYHAARGDPRHTWLNEPANHCVVMKNRKEALSSSASARRRMTPLAGAPIDAQQPTTATNTNGIQLVLYPETGHNNVVGLAELMPFFQKLPLFGNTDPSLIVISASEPSLALGGMSPSQRHAANAAGPNPVQESIAISSLLFQPEHPEKQPLVPMPVAARGIRAATKLRRNISGACHAIVAFFAVVIFFTGVTHGVNCSSSSSAELLYVPQFITWSVLEACSLMLILWLSWRSPKYGMASDDPKAQYFLCRIVVYSVVVVISYVLAPYWLSSQPMWELTGGGHSAAGDAAATPVPAVAALPSSGICRPEPLRQIMIVAVVGHYLHLLWTVIRNK